MITEVARSHFQSLEDWARQWSQDGTEGASEIAFLMQRAARMIRRTIGEPSHAGPAGAEEDGQSGTEPLLERQHPDPADVRSELADG